MKQKLNSKQIVKKIEEKKDDIRKYSVQKIGLFGSFLKNKQKRGSDIDIIVNFNKISFDNYIELKFFLEKLFRKKVDLVIGEDLKPELKHVKREAQYAKL